MEPDDVPVVVQQEEEKEKKMYVDLDIIDLTIHSPLIRSFALHLLSMIYNSYSVFCELVTHHGSAVGRLEITHSYLYFKQDRQQPLPQPPDQDSPDGP